MAKGIGSGIAVGGIISIMVIVIWAITSSGYDVQVVTVGAKNPNARTICANYREEWPLGACLRELARANPYLKIFSHSKAANQWPLEDGTRVVVPGERVLNKVCNPPKALPNHPQEVCP